MGTNFQFTGAPKLAMYKPKGLDWFMTKPKAMAELKGAAMSLNQATTIDANGIHAKDIKAVNEMSSFIDKGRESMTERILEKRPITDQDVTSMVKNYNNKKEVDDNVAIALENAQKISQYETMLLQAATSSGDWKYYDKLKKASMERWGGSFDPESESGIRIFQPYEGPKRMDIDAWARKKYATAKDNMVLQSRGRVNPENDLKQYEMDVAGGTQNMYTIKQAEDIYGNRAALDAVEADMKREMEDENTEIGAYIKFMGKEDMEGYFSTVLNVRDEFSRTDRKASRNQLQMGAFNKAGEPIKPAAMSPTLFKTSPDIKLSTERNKVKTINAPVVENDLLQGDIYISSTNKAYKNLLGSSSLTVDQLQFMVGHITGTYGEMGIPRELENNPLLSFISQVNTSNSGAISGYKTQVEEFKTALKNLKESLGGDASLSIAPSDFQGYSNREITANSLGTPSLPPSNTYGETSTDILNQKKEVLNTLTALQNSSIDFAKNNMFQYWQNEQLTLTIDGKDTDLFESGKLQMSQDLSNRTILKHQVMPDGTFELVNHNYNRDEDDSKTDAALEAEVLRLLQTSKGAGSYGSDESAVKGYTGGFTITPYMTSYDVEDINLGADIAGKDNSHFKESLRDMAVFEVKDESSGEIFYYSISNKGQSGGPSFPSPGNLGIQTKKSDNTLVQDGEGNAIATPINVVVGNAASGTPQIIPSVNGDVYLEKTDIGFETRIFNPITKTFLPAKRHPTSFAAMNYIYSQTSKR